MPTVVPTRFEAVTLNAAPRWAPRRRLQRWSLGRADAADLRIVLLFALAAIAIASLNVAVQNPAGADEFAATLPIQEPF